MSVVEPRCHVRLKGTVQSAISATSQRPSFLHEIFYYLKHIKAPGDIVFILIDVFPQFDCHDLTSLLCPPLTMHWQPLLVTADVDDRSSLTGITPMFAYSAPANLVCD
ncbi:hypothetical protein TIFTF001_039059 [Ficus carica]|uniref:Uncharacterized protein n=1 Tax=Ficus carica TaxID=3494 RepID=A0AA88E8G9_FICCA|nr:hypothetical protein TIFTF001_039059 [Ficus carica]